MNKLNFKKLIFLIAVVLTLNIPLLLLGQKRLLSKEQSPLPSSYFDVTLEDFPQMQQAIIPQENNWSGISLTMFSAKLFSVRDLTLEIQSTQNEGLLRKQTYKIKPDYLSSTVQFAFEPITDSQSKEYEIKIYPTNASSNINTNQYNIRPLYPTNNTYSEIYYRSSQYKSTIFKNPILVIFYFLLNCLLIAFLAKILAGKQK